jgi:hypothetical protein
MESKVVSGLYLNSEILDCDCQEWAWVRGFLAGCAVSKGVCADGRVTDEHPVSLSMVFVQNLRFLDRQKEILYPWTRESRSIGESEHVNEKEQMI